MSSTCRFSELYKFTTHKNALFDCATELIGYLWIAGAARKSFGTSELVVHENIGRHSF